MSDTALKVLLLTDADVFAGTERHMLDLARGLRGEGVDVKIACPSPAALEDAARADGIPVVVIQKRGILSQEPPNQVASLLRSGKIDIVHAHNGRSWLTSALAVSRAGKGRCFATQHFIDPNHATQTGVKALVSKLAHHWVVSKTSGIIAISEAVKQAMLERHDAPNTKITVIRNGITPPKPSQSEIDTVKQELRLRNGQPLIVCAARLQPEKDIPTLLAAMKRVANTLPDALCVVAGTGDEEQNLRNQVEEMGLSKSVRMLGFRKDAHALIATSDLFVLPSLAEPFGLVLLEAMALGKPVVATRAGGPVEIVADGETGLLVCPRSPDAMADAIIGILADTAMKTRIGAQAAKRFDQHFTVNRMARDVHSKYLVRPQ